MSYTKSTVEKYTIHPEEDQCRCLWAICVLDDETWTFFATSDCGNYSYRWCIENQRSFKQFLTQLDRSYFLSKISDESEVDEEESIKRMKEYCIEDYREGSITKQEAREQFDKIKNIEAGYLDDDFEHVVYNELGWDYLDLIVKCYPNSAITFYEVVFKELQKILKDEIKENTNGWK